MIVAAVAVLAGVAAATAAGGYEAAVRTEADNEWRDLLGPLGSVSIGSAVTAVVFGLIAALIGERGSRRGVAAIVGLVLGAITLAYWFWVIQGILRTT